MNPADRDALRQFTLPVALPESRSFDSFVVGPNAEIVAALSALHERPGGGLIFLWGGHASGKTHLLYAVCESHVERGLSASYVPLDPATTARPPEIIMPEARSSLLCLDDVNAICGNRPWELAIFNAYNSNLEAGGTMIVTADASPAGLQLALEDLKSRLMSGLTLKLRALDDQAKREVLRARAAARGFELPESVADYMLRWLPRDLGRLLDVLDRLDAASLAAQRRLTLPFVKMLLEDDT